jgi:23S rRNA pseudouridine955/2504/2580 synthase
MLPREVVVVLVLLVAKMQQIIYQHQHQMRLDRFLSNELKIPAVLVQKLVRTGKILLNSCKTQANCRLNNQDCITIFANISANKQANTATKNISLAQNPVQIKNFWQNVIYEDLNIIAINKPSGLSTQGGTGIAVSVDDFIASKGYQLVHRLDKDTSGILLIAKNKQWSNWLTEAFRHKNISKNYLAIVIGQVKKEQGIINIPLAKKSIGKNDRVMPDIDNGKEAVTEFIRQKVFAIKGNFYSLLLLKPITGRTHQLRVHCKELGNPIVGDVKYGGTTAKQTVIANRLCLHASEIVISNYCNGEDLKITAPIPKFIKDLVF